MKKYAVSDLVKEVKVLLDRNQESSGLLTPDDTDTLSQAELIKSKIVDAASIILSDAPVDMVDGIKLDNISVSWASKNNAYVGTVYMPADMIRLLSVRASDWNRNAEIITENDEAYKYQGCKYGVRGNPDRPIAAIVHTKGGRYLELYTSKSNSVTVDFTYVAQPEIITESSGVCYINLQSNLKDAILYMAGYLTCVSMGDTDTAAGLFGVARKLAHIVEPTTS